METNANRNQRRKATRCHCKHSFAHFPGLKLAHNCRPKTDDTTPARRPTTRSSARLAKRQESLLKVSPSNVTGQDGQSSRVEGSKEVRAYPSVQRFEPSVIVYFQSIRYFRFMAGERWGRCLEGLSSCIPEVAFPDI